jgi:hypothetical protein
MFSRLPMLASAMVWILIIGCQSDGVVVFEIDGADTIDADTTVNIEVVVSSPDFTPVYKSHEWIIRAVDGISVSPIRGPSEVNQDEPVLFSALVGGPGNIDIQWNANPELIISGNGIAGISPDINGGNPVVLIDDQFLPDPDFPMKPYNQEWWDGNPDPLGDPGKCVEYASTSSFKLDEIMPSGIAIHPEGEYIFQKVYSQGCIADPDCDWLNGNEIDFCGYVWNFTWCLLITVDGGFNSE